MGIPGFYRWVVTRFPKVSTKTKSESESEQLHDSFVEPKIDSTLPNPNGIEFDNLYIDLVGYIC